MKEKYKQLLDNSFKKLSITPYSGHFQNNFPKPLRVHNIGKHIIIYNINEGNETLEILKIIYNRRNLTDIDLLNKAKNEYIENFFTIYQ